MIVSTIYKSMKNTDVNVPSFPKVSQILGVVNQLITAENALIYPLRKLLSLFRD